MWSLVGGGHLSSPHQLPQVVQRPTDWTLPRPESGRLERTHAVAPQCFGPTGRKHSYVVTAHSRFPVTFEVDGVMYLVAKQNKHVPATPSMLGNVSFDLAIFGYGMEKLLH